jgi:hypothetical protein
LSAASAMEPPSAPSMNVAEMDRRRRRRGPQVRQERGPADGAIARSAPLGLSAPLPLRGASRPRFLRPTSPTRGHDQGRRRSRAAGGYAGGRRRDPRRDPRRDQRRGRPPPNRAGRVASPGGRGRAAELASEAARAEGASLPCHRPWPAAVAPGRPSGRMACGASTCAVARNRTFALDGRASHCDGTAGLGAIRVASTPGEGGIPRPGRSRRRPI